MTIIDPAGEEFRLRLVRAWHTTLQSCVTGYLLTGRYSTEASKLRLVEWPMYALLLWSLKAAMAVFYMRLMVSRASSQVTESFMSSW